MIFERFLEIFLVQIIQVNFLIEGEGVCCAGGAAYFPEQVCYRIKRSKWFGGDKGAQSAASKSESRFETVATLQIRLIQAGKGIHHPRPQACRPCSNDMRKRYFGIITIFGRESARVVSVHKQLCPSARLPVRVQLAGCVHRRAPERGLAETLFVSVLYRVKCLPPLAMRSRTETGIYPQSRIAFCLLRLSRQQR